MAPTLLSLLLVFALAFAISVQGTLGSIECENLNEDSCAYAVSSTGRRIAGPGGASEIVADKLSDWIEMEDCISTCGVDRKALGISLDSLLDNRFTGKLCSVECYRGCPNIVDLYFNLAAGEGVFLPKFCEALGSNGLREMAKIQSSGLVNDKALSPLSDHFEVAADIGSNEAALISARGITGERKLIFGQLLKGAPIPSSQPYVGSGTNGPLAATHQQEASIRRLLPKKIIVPPSHPSRRQNKIANSPRPGPLQKAQKEPPPPPLNI
ncbi:hypothetical protein OROHE_009865 [Orobanche hederae]